MNRAMGALTRGLGVDSSEASAKPSAFRAKRARRGSTRRSKLVAASHSDTGRTIPMARLIAIDKTAEKASEVARRAAQWIVASYVGPVSTFCHLKKLDKSIEIDTRCIREGTSIRLFHILWTPCRRRNHS
jgi:hypothetical protein